MSKVDAQRAMREAKYARYQERAQDGTGGRARTSTAPPVAPPRQAAAAPVTAPETAAVTSTETCGHKSMNGRACTREAGHSEKNHRYS